MRVASLDFIRGVAVLGILAINIAGFAGPSIGTLTPNLPLPARAVDEAAFAFAITVGGAMRIEPIEMMAFDGDGKITSMKAYWGPQNITQL